MNPEDRRGAAGDARRNRSTTRARCRRRRAARSASSESVRRLDGGWDVTSSWVLRVANAEGRCVLSQRGTAKAMFRAAPRGVRGDRVARLELTFDTIGLWQHLTRASRSPVAEPYAAVPNTLEDAHKSQRMRASSRPRRGPSSSSTSTTPGCASVGLVPTRPWARPWRASRGPSRSGRDHEDRRPGGAGPRLFRADHELHEAGPAVPNFLRVVPLVRGNDDAQPSHMLGVLRTSSRSSPASDAEKKNRKTQKNTRPPHSD